MKEERDILQILRHSRHDWLNVIQLIKGNLTLKKYDRVEEIIQEIVYQTQNESKLSNLNMRKFASEILVFNWGNGNHFQLEFEVIGDCVDLHTFDESLSTWFAGFSCSLNESCVPFGENHLQLTVELMEEKHPRFTFDFHGSLQEVDHIKKFLVDEKNWNEQLQLVESYISKEEFYITIQLVL